MSELKPGDSWACWRLSATDFSWRNIFRRPRRRRKSCTSRAGLASPALLLAARRVGEARPETATLLRRPDESRLRRPGGIQIAGERCGARYRERLARAPGLRDAAARRISGPASRQEVSADGLRPVGDACRHRRAGTASTATPAWSRWKTAWAAVWASASGCCIQVEGTGHGKYQRVCTEGPVFWADKVIWENEGIPKT